MRLMQLNSRFLIIAKSRLDGSHNATQDLSNNLARRPLLATFETYRRTLVVLAIPTTLLATAPDLTVFTILRIAQGLCMASGREAGTRRKADVDLVSGSGTILSNDLMTEPEMTPESWSAGLFADKRLTSTRPMNTSDQIAQNPARMANLRRDNHGGR
jgi:hypothetical protein